MGQVEARIHNPSPRGGRMTIAQHLSAGTSKRNGSQSVKRTADLVIQQSHHNAIQSSVLRTLVRESGTPALKCWAIVIRPLCGLFNYFLCRTALRSVLTIAVVANLLAAGSIARASSTF